jgi:hypothetical protein
MDGKSKGPMSAPGSESNQGTGEEVSLPMWNSFTTFNIIVHHFAVGVEVHPYTFLSPRYPSMIHSEQNNGLMKGLHFYSKDYMQLFAFGPRGAMSIYLRSSHEWCSAT